MKKSQTDREEATINITMRTVLFMA